MKNFISLCILTLFGFILSSCDPAYNAEWKIVNKTNNNIEITTEYEDFSDRGENSYNSLSSQASIILYDEFSIGQASSVLNMRDLPFKSLTITNSKGITSTKDLLIRENWNSQLVDDDSVLFEIIIFPNDFE